MEVVVTCDVRSRGHVSRVTRPSTCRVTCCGPGGRGGGARRPKHAASVLRKETKNIILVITISVLKVIAEVPAYNTNKIFTKM